VNEQRELADRVLESLQAGTVPWRFPHNRLPEFAPLFGKFFTGEPLTEAEVSYDELDEIIKATNAKIIHNGRSRKPRFHRLTDKIVMPVRSVFQNEAHYRASLIHELLHHLEQPERLGWIGSDHQSELVCEVGTAFLESSLRLGHDQDNTNLIKWLPKFAEGIEADPNYLFRAVAVAEFSVNYLLDLRRKKEAA
jgi:antirestriction protein ArdC